METEIRRFGRSNFLRIVSDFLRIVYDPIGGCGLSSG